MVDQMREQVLADRIRASCAVLLAMVPRKQFHSAVGVRERIERDLVDLADGAQERSSTFEPGAITISPDRFVTPADVAKQVASRVTREYTEHVQMREDGSQRVERRPGSILPTGPTEPSTVRPPQKFQMGEITDRDRFLDDASDRRAALMAASRSMAGTEYDGEDQLTRLSTNLYEHLREGKS